jgi:hypothetical protein
MIAYGVMCRPDMMADVLGAAGFFLACQSNRRWLPAAAVLLALACLTKQTAAVWLLAALVVLLFHQGVPRRACLLGGLAVAVVFSVIAILAATTEPYILPSLRSQLGMPFDPQQQFGILVLLFHRSPEMLFFVLVGCGLWMSKEHNDRALFILAGLWLLAAVLGCAKRGSDVNYFLPLRIIEAIAAGTLCAAALRSGRHHLGWTLLTFAGVLAMVPSTMFAAETAVVAMRHRAWLDSADGLAERQRFQRCVQLAADPNVRLLTDSDRLAVYQGPRAAFFDCYLFRLQADAGRINPQELVDRLQSGWYQYVILSADISIAHHDYFFYSLPESVAAAVKANYTLQSQEAGQYIYVLRHGGADARD